MYVNEWLERWQLPAGLAGVFVLLLVLEAILPLRKRTRPWLRHLLTNVLVSALAFAAGSLVVRRSALILAGWAGERPFGLLNTLPLPFPAQLAIAFLLMDLTFYYWHLANHKVRILWRFHNVHHIDQDLDVSTSNRFHLIEVLYSTPFRVLQVVLIGVSIRVYVIYELVFQCATMFHHSNMRLPLGLERLLNKIIVTPRMHGVHHSAVLAETDSNYSVIFRWWDWLHGTLRLNVPQSEITIGVPAYQGTSDNGFWHALTLPFRGQRRYWRRPDGTRPTREAPAGGAGVRTLVA